MHVETSQAPAPLAAAGLPGVASYLQAAMRALQGWLPGAVGATVGALERAARTAPEPNERLQLMELHVAAQRQAPSWMRQLLAAIGDAAHRDAESATDDDPVQERTLVLTLLDEDAIDEDIAVSRVVQLAELRAESLLRELAARCSGLRGLPGVSTDAHPLRPAVLAGALRTAVGRFGLEPRQRVLLLREMATVFGEQLVKFYEGQVELLAGWGVEPIEFQVRPSLDGPPRLHPSGSGEVFAERPDGVRSPRAVADDALRRLDVGGGQFGALPPAETMARLLAVLLSRVTLGSGARRMIERLDAPARRLAEVEPGLWKSADHPLWQLLDRLVSAGSVHTGFDLAADGPSAAAFEQALEQIERADQPDPGQLRAALAAADAAVTGLLDERVERVAPQAEAIDARLGRADIESRVREQIVEQVRRRGAPPALRQFLVGPWVAAVAHSAETHGPESLQFQTQAELVESLLDVCRRPRGTAIAPDRYTRCMTHARLGLLDAGLANPRVEAELADLARVLHNPWVRVEAEVPGTAEPEDPDVWTRPHVLPGTDPLPATAPITVIEAGPVSVITEDGVGHDGDASRSLGLHEALPTVLIGMGDDDASDPGRAEAAAASWVDALEPGVMCRVFLLERWMNVQLVWRSLNRSTFVFVSRHGERNHTLPRAALHKLRAAGLATTIERGQFIAQALGELAREDTR